MKLLTLLACYLGTSLALLGQKTASTHTGITGEWNGSYEKLRFDFHISKEGGEKVGNAAFNKPYHRLYYRRYRIG